MWMWSFTEKAKLDAQELALVTDHGEVEFIAAGGGSGF